MGHQTGRGTGPGGRSTGGEVGRGPTGDTLMGGGVLGWGRGTEGLCACRTGREGDREERNVTCGDGDPGSRVCGPHPPGRPAVGSQHWGSFPHLSVTRFFNGSASLRLPALPKRQGSHGGAHALMAEH